jgi:sugar phosphate isomerase/epimerase
MATIRGHKLSVADEVEIAAKAGYAGVELWVDKVRQYTEGGNTLSDLKKRIADLGLVVEGAIGFPAWGVDDDQRRAKALEDFRRDMDVIAQVGGRRIAAPPAGINRTPGMDLSRIAERYRAVLELGREMGVVPQLEIWGSAVTLGRMSEAAFVAVQADHPDACLLLDAYHLYRGGSSFQALRLLNGAALHVFHINDYPAEPPREQMTDAQRVFPGDGVAPLGQLFRDLQGTGFRGALSLELFNPEYWKQDALTVAQTGLEKTRAAVQKALG